MKWILPIPIPVWGDSVSMHFHQRGSYAAVLRIVASDIPTPEDTRYSGSCAWIDKEKERAGSCDGTEQEVVNQPRWPL